MKKYKWQNPIEWLEDKTNSWGEDSLRAAFEAILSTLDSDQVQDIFQQEMEEDGYFNPIRERRTKP